MTESDATATGDGGEGDDARDEDRHPGSTEEWVFGAWSADGSMGLLSGHRIVGRTAWYWSALGRVGRPLLHVVDVDVPVRADPFIVKGEALWAEHHCDAAFEQWSIGNETYASALDDPAEALGRAYGTPTPIAFDLEWYGIEPVVWVDEGPGVLGYRQRGVVHGAIEILGEPTLEVEEIPASRWHRWAHGGGPLAPAPLPSAVAHSGVRAPFAFPDGTTADLVLTPDGWAERSTR